MRSLGLLPLLAASALLSRRLSCPPELKPDLDKLRAERAQGPVLAAQPPPPARKPRYVFVITPPLYGSTALFALLATSPNVATLCGAGKVNCEGQYLLQQAGLMPASERYTADFPKNWTAAVGVFAQTWNMSKPLLVDKSPSNVFKTEGIARDLVKAGRDVDFVIMSRSPCFVETLDWKAPALKADFTWENYARLLEKARHLPGTRSLFLHYEDLVTDPYTVSRRLLEFLPQLGQVDPAWNPIHELGAPVYGERTTRWDRARKEMVAAEPDTDRAKSVVEYMLERRAFPAFHAAVDRRYAPLMAKLGYAETPA